MRKINAIVIHCSDTLATADIGAKEIRAWHTAPPPAGNGWADIGYHYVIRRDGTVEAGRPVDRPGAHVMGYNANSLGLCLVGGRGDCGRPENNYTPAQWAALKALVIGLLKTYPGAIIKGHRDYPNVPKACPCFEVKAWLKKEGLAGA